MNYYHQLLDSYSKLKKRSLKLIKEQDPKAGGGGMSGEQLAQQYIANAPITDPSQGAPVSDVNGKPTKMTIYKRAATQTVPEAVIVQNLSKFGGPMTVVGGSNDEAAFKAFVQKLGGEEGAPTKKGMESDKDNEGETQAAEEEAGVENEIANQQNANEQQLQPAQVDLGLVPNPETGERELLPELDYGLEGKSRSGFVQNLLRTFRNWTENTDVPIEVKVESAELMKDIIALAVKISDLEEKDEKLSGEDANKLKSIFNQISVTSDGAIVFTGIGDQEDANSLYFGLTAAGGQAKGVASMWETINDQRIKYNKEVSKTDKTQTIPDPNEVTLATPGSAGSTANHRSQYDELTIASAGLLGGIVGGAPGPDRDWNLQQLRDNIAEANEIFPEGAQTLARGLDAIEGRAVGSLLTEQSKELTVAIMDRLMLDYPDTFPDEETATEFVEELAQDEGGFLAFATTLLLRQATVQKVMGDHDIILSVQGGKRWSRGDGSYRRKLDVAWFVNATDEESLNEHLGTFVRAGENVSKFLETKTIQEFIDDGILVESDLPPSLQDDRDKKITMAAISVKTLPNSDSPVNKGSQAGNTTVAAEGDKGYNSPARKEITADLRKRGGVTKEAVDGCHQMYDAVRDQNLPADGERSTQAALFQQVNKNASDPENRPIADAAIMDMFMGGGVAMGPELTVVETVDDGEFTAESDEAFKNDILKGIKSGKYEIHFGGCCKFDEENFSSKNNQAFIIERHKDGTGTPLVRVHSSPSQGRANISKTKEAQQRLKRHGGSSKPKQESTMLRQFLNAQADLIKELLATQ